jgi:LysM domain
MSAMRAVELPEIPAASPQDSARTRASARWTATVEPAPDATAPDQAPATAPDQATAPAPDLAAATAPDQAAAPARPHSPRAQAARPQPGSAPLRLTRRGRIVVAVAAALLLAALSLVIAASAQAINHPLPSHAAQQTLTRVTVRPGQSLWSVAESADPSADTRVVIQQIIELNGLTGNVVFSGQRLWVPRG